MFLGHNENCENAGKLSSQDLRFNKNLKTNLDTELTGNFFQNSATFDKRGFDQFTIVLGFSNIVLTWFIVELLIKYRFTHCI